MYRLLWVQWLLGACSFMEMVEVQEYWVEKIDAPLAFRKHCDFCPHPVNPSMSHGQELYTPVIVSHGKDKEDRSLWRQIFHFYTAFSFILFLCTTWVWRGQQKNLFDKHHIGINSSPWGTQLCHYFSYFFSSFKMFYLPKSVPAKGCLASLPYQSTGHAENPFETCSRHIHAQAQEVFGSFDTSKSAYLWKEVELHRVQL